MARPRVFISSTFLDLKHVRADLARFVRDMGYDPVDNNKGNIPYGSEEALEEYCYKEIELVDVLVAVIGGRYGSDSHHQPYSVSQMEIKTAIKRGKQVYIFVDTAVLSEYSTYRENKKVEGIKYIHVDDPKIYHFLDEINALPNNNPISPFQTSEEITEYLREQWAGLFQVFLQAQVHQKEVRIIEDLQKTAQTLNQLVTFLTEDKRNSSEAIQSILLSSHPAFQQLKQSIEIPFRVFFSNHTELSELLKGVRMTRRQVDDWDHPGVEEWVRIADGTVTNLDIDLSIFDSDGRLKIFTQDEWQTEWMGIRQWAVRPRAAPRAVTRRAAEPVFPPNEEEDLDPFADQ